MRITSSIPAIETGTAVTMGNFDGLHLGHMKLIRRLLDIALHRDLTSIVLTFDPHPLEYFAPDRKVPRICELPEMEWLLRDTGIDYLVRLPFTPGIAGMTPERFWQDILINGFRMQCMVVGEDHQFGKDRSGHPDTLRKLGVRDGVEVIVEQHVHCGGTPVSSTRIRKLIEAGNLAEARQLLGHGLFFAGMVLHGAGRGILLGFPTANMSLPGRVLPPPGVYVSRTHAGNIWWNSVSYIGRSPTFNGDVLWLETHILEGSHDLYDQMIIVDMIDRLRPEIRFNSREALVDQMRIDCNDALTMLKTLDQGDKR